MSSGSTNRDIPFYCRTVAYSAPFADYSCVIDDTRRNCYAYIKLVEKYVSDVWLFNRGDTPASPEWKGPEFLPFKNCLPYAHPRLRYSIPRSHRQVHVEWEHCDGHVGCRIYFDERLVARMEEGKMPGWSLMAAQAGPLAHPLEPREPDDREV